MSTSNEFPICLRLAGRRVLLVGGGAVAEGKLRGLLAAGAVVRVIAPEATASITSLSLEGRVELLLRPFRRGDLEGYRLVFSATGDPLATAAVAAEARRVDAWLNAADEPASCDFTLPSVGRHGLFTVAVSTGGAAPAVAARVRRRLVAELSLMELGRARVSAVVRNNWKQGPWRSAVLRWVATFASSSKGLP